MSQQLQYLAQSTRSSGPDKTTHCTTTLTQSELALDLLIIEAGLRLKVLPLRCATIRGHLLSLSVVERRKRQRVLFELSGSGPLSIIDVGLFADTVARHPEVAERLWHALRSKSQR
jgi:hypothetical protein